MRRPHRWGLIPHWCKDPSGGRKPINPKCETVRNLPTFRDAYRARRCIVPVDGFFEWRAIKAQICPHEPPGEGLPRRDAFILADSRPLSGRTFALVRLG